MLKSTLYTALLLGGLTGGAASAAELVVIVSARTPVAALRQDQVAGIFLAEASSFPDGTEAMAVDQGIGSPLRDEFYQKVANRSPALMKAYWTKMIFTGRGQPPREAPNSAAVRRLVADNPGMIGYIERAALDPSVRPVLVLK
ncbi:phosphate ABC transporter substrate-binding protein [Pseudoduganella armeniaca]|uniref:Phosphate ABC transporter substrate-binding protein n=1 Tax=Pseudoduganella armeniaca TaxID=2072590 RepID=A0A2R4CA08_9BURK|nr:phosphate ABC transporter substrate-binding protein [Pseudoduganella armeniaca]AVR96466.1 phosphate ABC transporter substrate-binding protein [Pseudoduganella armeniaca]